MGIGNTLRVIQTNHIETSYQRLEKYGGKVFRPLHAGEIVGGDGITRTVKAYFGYDPDGYLIEVNERILPEKLIPAAKRAAAKGGP